MFGIKKIKVVPEKTKEELEKEKATRNFGLFLADYKRLCMEVKVGNELNFNKLYLTYFKKIRNYTAKRCKVFFATQVKDATEMAFAIFLNRLKKEKILEYGNLEAYVVEIAKNEYARQKTFNTSPLTEAEDFAEEETEEDPSDHRDVVELMKVVENLCAFCKLFLKRLHWEGHKQEELVTLMGFPTVNAVKTKHASIKLKLRKAFLNQQTDVPICQKLCRTGENNNDI